MVLHEIPSLTQEDQTLGSILLSDTFLFQEGCFLVLTREVPYLDIYELNAFYQDRFSTMKHFLDIDLLGKAISDPCEGNKIFLPQEYLAQYMVEIPMFTCKITMHEHGLKLYSEKLGYRVILFE